MRAEISRPADTGRPQTQHTTTIPSATPATEAEGPRSICLDIDPKLLRCDGVVHALVLTADEARRAAQTLLGMAAEVDRLETALAMEATGISVIPLKDDGSPAVDNWEEFQDRRTTRDEIMAWSAPRRSTLVAGGGEPA